MFDSKSMREAMLKAADQIGGHPESFRFGIAYISGGVEKACAIGWVAEYLGLVGAGGFQQVAGVLGGELAFYTRLVNLQENGYIWQHDAGVCAAVLRKYADTYFPETVSEACAA